LSTKIHAGTDALGLPVRLIAGPGQQNDAARGDDLIDGLKAQAVLADKGYDSDHLRQKIKAQGGQPVIPPRRHRKTPLPYDKHLYKERNAVERFFNKLKHFRRVATRYDKLLANFIGFIKIAAIAIWIR
jgi:putative transposase